MIGAVLIVAFNEVSVSQLGSSELNLALTGGLLIAAGAPWFARTAGLSHRSMAWSATWLSWPTHGSGTRSGASLRVRVVSLVRRR